MKTFPLTPDVPFVEGQVFTPELAYQSFYSPVFDDQTSYLGHRERITDDELDNGAGSIKAKVNAVEDGLKVTVETGLTLRHASGSLRLPDGSLVTKASALFTAPNNATSFAYFDQAGNIQCTTQAPALRSLLARIVTVSGAVSSLTDLRHPAQRMVNPIAASIKIFGGTNVTDKTATAAEVFDQGVYYFRDFTVPAGITITIDKFARFYCSGNVNIQGTIDVTSCAPGATPFATGATVSGNTGGLPGTGLGAGGGSSSSFGSASYSFAVQPYGSGGGLGFATGGTGAFAFGSAGAGGGGLWFESAGSIIIDGATINLDGEAAQATTYNSGLLLVTGAGGGSGGTLVLSSLTSILVTATSTILLRGGRGSDAIGNVAMVGNGGSGGGGGQFVAMAPSVNYSGATINVSGGAMGTQFGSGGGAVGGGAGGGNGGAGGRQSSGSTGRILQRLFVPIGS